ncbi:MAG TPA: DivIVA domain-containing protein [Candidatus Tetragenococcus pullicola]|nr:DivIVA domain-containing protein [Candidatus Tetragenococcus pullicola]
MVMSPLDIQNKSFDTKMRGYDKDDVDDFLDLVVRDYEETTQKNRELEKALKHADEKLEYFNELKDALNQSIIVAQDTADKVKTSASKESEVMVSAAQNKADELVTNAEKHADEVTKTAEEKAKEILTTATENARQLAVETNDLKKKTRVFHNNLSVMLQAQLEQVKSPEWEEILAPLSTYVQDSHEVIREVLSKELDNSTNTEVNSEQEDQIDQTEDVSVVESNQKQVNLPEQE